jgi:hypothetical protein
MRIYGYSMLNTIYVHYDASSTYNTHLLPNPPQKVCVSLPGHTCVEYNLFRGMHMNDAVSIDLH